MATYPWMQTNEGVDFAGDFQKGLQLGQEQQRTNIAKEQLNLDKRRQAMADILFPIQQQRAALGLQEAGYQINAAKTQNDIASLKLMHENQRKQAEPAFAAYLTALDYVSDDDALNNNFPEIPQGLLADQAEVLHNARLKRRQSAFEVRQRQQQLDAQINRWKEENDIQRSGLQLRKELGQEQIQANRDIGMAKIEAEKEKLSEREMNNKARALSSEINRITSTLPNLFGENEADARNKIMYLRRQLESLWNQSPQGESTVPTEQPTEMTPQATPQQTQNKAATFFGSVKGK